MLRISRGPLPTSISALIRKRLPDSNFTESRSRGKANARLDRLPKLVEAIKADLPRLSFDPSFLKLGAGQKPSSRVRAIRQMVENRGAEPD